MLSGEPTGRGRRGRIKAGPPRWHDGHGAELGASCRLADQLTHLYVLVPVLDDDKHYWVDDAEIEKLMHRGEGWLAAHPERELIVRRYLRRQPQLFFPALEQLDESAPVTEDPDPESEPAERTPLREHRLRAVEAVLEQSGARRVLDLGCGPGALLARLMAGRYERIVGMDVSARASAADGAVKAVGPPCRNASASARQGPWSSATRSSGSSPKSPLGRADLGMAHRRPGRAAGPRGRARSWSSPPRRRRTASAIC